MSHFNRFQLTKGPVEVDRRTFSFAQDCPQTKSGKHIVETQDDCGEPLPAPWCRQCGLEADALEEELRGDA